MDKYKQIIITFMMIAFIGTSFHVPYVQAGELVIPVMPKPGSMVALTPAFTPAHLQGLTIHQDNPLKFDFLIHKGEGHLEDGQKKEEYSKLVKYFLASLTVPDKDQWVNLSPYEHNRIIENNFGKTEMGRDLLSQDYLLKQIAASLMYPESGLGKSFWDKVYAEAQKKFGSTSAKGGSGSGGNIPVNTFNKVWIVPDQADVYESGNTVYILRSHLKVMLEEDYLATQKNESSSHLSAKGGSASGGKVMLEEDYLATNKNSVGAGPHACPTCSGQPQGVAPTQEIIRQIILPAIEKEVNEGKNFSLLRQIYSAMILATWYKKAFKESLLGKIYADKAKVKGVTYNSSVIPAKAGIYFKMDPRLRGDDINGIYQQYLMAFKKGVYNYIKEDEDKYTHQIIPRKYFSGGFQDAAALVLRRYDHANSPAMAALELPSSNSLDKAVVILGQDTSSSVKKVGSHDAELVHTDLREVLGIHYNAIVKIFHLFGVDLVAAYKGYDVNLGIVVLADGSISGNRLHHIAGHIFFKELDYNKLLAGELTQRIGYAHESYHRQWIEHHDTKGNLNEGINIEHELMDEIHAYMKSFSDFDGFDGYLLELERVEDILTTREEYLRGYPDNIVSEFRNSKKIAISLAVLKKYYQFDMRDNRRDFFWSKMILEYLFQCLSLSQFWGVLGQADVRRVGPTLGINDNAYNIERQTFKLFVEEYAKLHASERVSQITAQLEGDLAQMVIVGMDKEQNVEFRKGGIDLNSANLAMNIKRDGKGVPLPLAQQDLAQLSQIDGFVPNILEIKPAMDLPILNELKSNLLL